MSVNVHIEHIHDTLVNVAANMDLLQYGSISTAGDELNEQVHMNDDATRLYYGGSNMYKPISAGVAQAAVYLDRRFNDVEADGDVVVAGNIIRDLDSDTGIFMSSKKVDVVVDNSSFVECILDTVSTCTINDDGIDMDFIVKWDSGTTATFDGSTGFVGISRTIPDTALHVDGTITQKDDISAAPLTLSDSYAYGDNEADYLLRNYYASEGTEASPDDIDIGDDRNIYTDMWYARYGSAWAEMARMEVYTEGGACQFGGHWIWKSTGTTTGITNVFKMSYDGNISYSNFNIATGTLQFGAGQAVDTIETTITDDDTHFPTSGGVVDYVASEALWDRTTSPDLTFLKNSGDNVGIGIAVPIRKLDISDNGGNAQLRLTHIAGGPITQYSEFNVDSNGDLTINTTGTFVGIDSNREFHPDGGIVMGQTVDTIETTLTNDSSHLPTSSAVYAALLWDRATTYTYLGNSGDTVGIGVSDPSAKLEVFDTGSQLLLSYDASNSCLFTVNAAGNLTMNTTGTVVVITHELWVTGTGDSYVNGSFGVGVASPSGKLHVRHADSTYTPGTNSQLILEGAAAKADLNIEIIGAVDQWIKFSDATSGIGSIRYNQTTDLMEFKANNTAILNLIGGNAGIGVSDPDTKLEIFFAGCQLKLSFDGTDNCTFGVDTAGDMTVTPSGSNVKVVGAMQIGDGGTTNYMNVAADGEITLVGTARVTQCLIFSNDDLGKGGTAPDQVILGNYSGYSYDIGDDSVFVARLPTDWAVGTDVTLAVRYYINETYATDSGEVQYQVLWSAVPIDASEAVDAPTQSGTIDSGDFNIPAAAKTLKQETLGTISGASLSVGDEIGMTFSRVALDGGNNPTADPVVTCIGFVYTKDKFGTAT